VVADVWKGQFLNMWEVPTSPLRRREKVLKRTLGLERVVRIGGVTAVTGALWSWAGGLLVSLVMSCRVPSKIYAGLTRWPACRRENLECFVCAGRCMVGPRHGVWRPAVEIRGSNPWGSCWWTWHGMNGVLSGLVAAGPCGGEAAVWRQMARPSGRMDQGARREPAGARHRRVLLRITSCPHCRRCVCRGELAGEPRSIAHLHGTWWRL